MIGGFLLPQSDGGYQSDGEGEPLAVDDAGGGRGQLGEEGVLLGLRPQGVRVPVGDSLAVRPLGLVALAGLGGAWQVRSCAPAPPAVRSASRRSPAPPNRRAGPNRVVAAQHGQVRHRLAHLTANDRVPVRQLRRRTHLGTVPLPHDPVQHTGARPAVAEVGRRHARRQRRFEVIPDRAPCRCLRDVAQGCRAPRGRRRGRGRTAPGRRVRPTSGRRSPRPPRSPSPVGQRAAPSPKTDRPDPARVARPASPP